MTPIKIDHSAQASSLVATQYCEATKFLTVLAKLMGRAQDIENALMSMYDTVDVDSATGVNLDVIGDIVGISRNIPQGVLIPFFGFADTSAGVVFGEEGTLAAGGRFREESEGFTVTSILGDPEYRMVIKAKVIRNHAIGTAEDIINGLNFIFSGSLNVVDDIGGMKINIGVSHAVSYIEKVLIQQLDLLPRPNGVGISSMVSFDVNNSFGFADQQGAKGLGEESVLAAGYRNYTLSQLASFRRASTATYIDAAGVLRTAAVNEARFDYDPVTHALRGLLIETAATNLALFSEQFDNAVWGRGNCTITPNAVAAPDGTMTADAVVRTAVGNHYLLQTLTGTVAAGKPFTAFIQMKSGSYTGMVRVWLKDGAGVSLVINNAQLTPTWQEVVVSGTYPAGATGAPAIYIDPSDDVGVAGDTFYVWGADVKDGLVKSSYIPTTNMPVTRAADIATVTADLTTDGVFAEQF